jgi:hypothetical protein
MAAQHTQNTNYGGIFNAVGGDQYNITIVKGEVSGSSDSEAIPSRTGKLSSHFQYLC